MRYGLAEVVERVESNSMCICKRAFIIICILQISRDGLNILSENNYITFPYNRIEGGTYLFWEKL